MGPCFTTQPISRNPTAEVETTPVHSQSAQAEVPLPHGQGEIVELSMYDVFVIIFKVSLDLSKTLDAAVSKM